MFNEIPVMDDPLGKHWNQPRNIRLAPMDATHVILHSREVAELYEYSSTLPTGVYPGKCWIRRESDRTLLAWFGEETPDHMCGINFRELLVMDA